MPFPVPLLVGRCGLGTARVDMLLRLVDEEMPAAVARRVAVVLVARQMPELADDVALVVAELVANAEIRQWSSGPVRSWSAALTVSVTSLA
ncbi:hypothetical protein [Kitasatospora sp. NPDC050463]|uniref:hypothetical protein n=1 Tax=Kitasatospora sp. NPDC050463 TaxID=3155786 RepID=UPI0033F8BF79